MRTHARTHRRARLLVRVPLTSVISSNTSRRRQQQRRITKFVISIIIRTAATTPCRGTRSAHASYTKGTELGGSYQIYAMKIDSSSSIIDGQSFRMAGARSLGCCLQQQSVYRATYRTNAWSTRISFRTKQAILMIRNSTGFGRSNVTTIGCIRLNMDTYWIHKSKWTSPLRGFGFPSSAAYNSVGARTISVAMCSVVNRPNWNVWSEWDIPRFKIWFRTENQNVESSMSNRWYKVNLWMMNAPNVSNRYFYGCVSNNRRWWKSIEIWWK